MSWNNNPIRKDRIFYFILPLMVSILSLSAVASPGRVETGTLSIYFMQEQVGYEEYSWEEDEMGFTLSVRGRMTRPIAMEIESLIIRLDKSYIARNYRFKGQVSGVIQDIESVFMDGKVEHTKKVAGQERTEVAEVKRDAVLLPNPIFSPYMVLTKKYLCALQEGTEISIYIIPQMEMTAALEPKEDFPCSLVLQMGPTKIEIETDEEGRLNGLEISSQSLRVVRNKAEDPIR